MKRITNKHLQAALLRGAVVVSGGMATIVTSLFMEDIYGVLATLFIGSAIICAINDSIKV